MSYTNRQQVLPENVERVFSQIDKPAVSVTLLIVTATETDFDVLLVKRTRSPFKDMWSLPGDIIALDETLEESARRIMKEKTGMENFYLEQLYTFGDPGRDPRGRLITVAYLCLLPNKTLLPEKINDILQKKWYPSKNLPPLAFDHDLLISFGIERIINKMGYSTIAKDLLGESFRLSELQKLYELALSGPIDKRNFRKWLKNLALVEPTGEVFRSGRHRPAKLYRFTSNNLVVFK